MNINEDRKSVLIVFKILFFYTFFLIKSQAFAQGKQNIAKQIVYVLANDSMEGRVAGSFGERKANTYILNCFKTIELQEINTSYNQTFVFPKDSIRIDTAYNIIGLIENKAPLTIIIGAHYDHLGMGGPKSRSLTNKKIHNGADDNASGVALMLMLAEELKKSGNKKYNYLFVAFSAHENGLFGSEAFVNQKIINKSNVKLMLNFDMVGRLDKQSPILKATKDEKNLALDSLLNETTHKFEIKFCDANISKSDATAFMKLGVQTITFSTGVHDDYHKVSDTAEKLNYEGMYEIEKYIFELINKL